MEITVSINPTIFKKNSTMCRGIVVASGIVNCESCPPLEKLLCDVMEKGQNSPVNLDTDPVTQMWKQLHRDFGSNPNKHPPSQVALRKRIQGGKQIPFVSNVIAVMNINSIMAHTSVGGDDIDHVSDHLELRHARGDETFIPLFEDGKEEHPEPGEMIYVDSLNRVMCRRLNWRNSHLSRIRLETTNIVMNIDGLGDGCEPMVVKTRDRVADMLIEFCNAQVTTALLTSDAPMFHSSTNFNVSK